MNPLYGKLAFNPDDNCWEAAPPLNQFAESGVRPNQPVDERALKKTLAQAQAALDQMKRRIIERLGPDGKNLLDALQEAAETDDDEADHETDVAAADDDAEPDVHERYEARRRLEERRRRSGMFPIHIPTEGGTPPSQQQEAALVHLRAHETTVHRAVLQALFEAYQSYQAPSRKIKSAEQLRLLVRIDSATIERAHHQGVSYVVFHVECAWEVEHGPAVVYHPVKGAHWATADVLPDLIESDECFEEWIELAGNEELVEAVYAGDDARIQELIARGDDINDCGPDAWPPLRSAVEQLDVELVKRLLALGADPNLVDSEGQTALQRARATQKQFAPSSDDRLMNAAFKIMQRLNAAAYLEGRAKIEEIVGLLERAARR